MPRLLAVLPLLALAGCVVDPKGLDTDTEASSSSTGDPTTGGSSSGEATDASSTGEPCPVGGLECPCTDGGFCDAGLTCDLGTCVEGCAVGALGCKCTDGGTCDAGLACEAGTCIEGVSETCGDGVVDVFEECDDGPLNGDAAACTSSCRVAVCGDKLVGPGEACDGSQGCGPGCALMTCGNGQVDPGEECEPVRPGDAECAENCTDARKLVFVTSKMWKGGEIGGVAGGDEKCQGLADAAGRPGVFKAWLATSKDDAPLVRFSWHLVPYVDAAGEVLANDWTKLGAAPLLTEMGSPVAPSEAVCGDTKYTAWSVGNDGPFFAQATEYACEGWSTNSGLGAVARIKGSEFGTSLAPACWKISCASLSRLFCVEQ